MDTIQNVAWATGVFEGEGSILTKGLTGIILKIDMTDEDILQRVGRVFGGYVKELPARNENWKTVWRWQVGRGAEAEKILQQMLPYLGERRKEKALEAIAHREAGIKKRSDRNKLWDVVVELYAEGLTEQKIADKLGIKRSTVNMIRRRDSNQVTIQIMEPLPD